MADPIPFQKGFRARRTSPGSQHSRSMSLEYSTNGSIYLNEHEYGGRTLCPTKEDLRWLRDVLNQLEFCDHDLGEIELAAVWGRPGQKREHRRCKKCGAWIYEGAVETDIELPDNSSQGMP